MEYYSEKLVIVYGFLKIFLGLIFCIFKNFRVCVDCYEFMKVVIRVIGWEIIV